MNNQHGLVYQRYFHRLQYLQNNWKWFFLLGLILMALGVLSVAYSAAVTEFSVILLGVCLLVGGLLQASFLFWTREWSGFFLGLFAAVLYTIAGLVLLANPIAGALGLTLLLAAFYVVGGIFRMVGSLMMRFEKWGWALLSGVIQFVLGLMIFAGWPLTGLWVLGLFIGIDLIFFGWFWLLLSLSAQSVSLK
jgi:uncharacterized membrane protein HdeD (DUF308 family)